MADIGDDFESLDLELDLDGEFEVVEDGSLEYPAFVHFPVIYHHTDGSGEVSASYIALTPPEAQQLAKKLLHAAERAENFRDEPEE